MLAKTDFLKMYKHMIHTTFFFFLIQKGQVENRKCYLLSAEISQIEINNKSCRVEPQPLHSVCFVVIALSSS